MHLAQQLLEEEKRNPQLKETLQSIYLKLCNNERFGRASDFVISLGGEVHLLYMCGECKEGPVHICNWVRCAKEQYLDQEYQTAASADAGHWRCPNNTC